MIVAMQESANEGQIQQVIEHLVKMGFEVHRSTGARVTVLGGIARTALQHSRSSGEGGSAGAAGWGVQAAQLSLFVSRTRRRGAQAAARGGRQIQAAGDKRGHGD